jgi:hypothetical protein
MSRTVWNFGGGPGLCSITRVRVARKAASVVAHPGKLVRWGQPYMRRAVERVFERRFGIDTSGFVYLEDLGYDDPDRVWHDPSEWLALRRVLKGLNLGTSDVFIDFGSGKGRALFTAALEFPFRRVIGVEIAPDLHRQAQANFRRNARRLRCSEVELVNADITDYDVPDDVTVAYLYSPVVGETFDRVIGNIVASVDRRPRALRVLYNFPFEHNRLLATNRVQVVGVASSRWPLRDRSGGHVIVSYVVLPRVEVPEVAALLAPARHAIRGAEHWLRPYDPGFKLVKHGRVHRRA